MTKAKLIVLACFCASFAAGVAAGLAWSRLAPKPHRDSWLARELDLTPQQREQMKRIWSSAMGTLRQQHREQRRAIRQERDKAIEAIFGREQKAQYEEVMKAYEDKSAELDAGRKKAFRDAVERTKQILTEPQRKKYEELMKRRPPHRSRRPGPPGPDAPPPPPPPSQPDPSKQ